MKWSATVFWIRKNPARGRLGVTHRFCRSYSLLWFFLLWFELPPKKLISAKKKWEAKIWDFKSELIIKNYYEIIMKCLSRKMTNETSAALLYGILPSIREICGKDQQAEKALIQTFLKAEKHAPGEKKYQNCIFTWNSIWRFCIVSFLSFLHLGFSDDFMRSFHKQAEALPYPYEATILATSSQHLREFQLSNDRWLSKRKRQQDSIFSELAPLIQSRADNLKKILSSIPRVIPDRPIFLQVRNSKGRA